ncbi:unnamed protein product, partial [Iphiclides podalirius]
MNLSLSLCECHLASVQLQFCGGIHTIYATRAHAATNKADGVRVARERPRTRFAPDPPGKTKIRRMDAEAATSPAEFDFRTFHKRAPNVPFSKAAKHDVRNNDHLIK